jgi:hypothetical protein
MPVPISSRSQREGEEFSFYGHLIEFKMLEMALDHFFREVVDGNVPLGPPDQDGHWWERSIQNEMVNRYSEPWCLIFEALADTRERLEEAGIPLDRLRIDESLRVTVTDRRGSEEVVVWERTL